MSSRRVEDAHVTDLGNLLSKSGLKCTRTVTESPEVVEEEEIEEEEILEEVAEEQQPTKNEAIPEEKPGIIVQKEIKKPRKIVFPTPSLRHILPHQTRQIEKENNIHVLPEDFKTNINPDLIPKIVTTPAQKYIDVIAELVGCTNYKSSMAEYWFLDTMANLLRRAQEDGLDKTTQAILMLWFCEWIKEMQRFDAADRERMMERFKKNMLSAASVVAIDERIPTPKKAGVWYKKEGTPKKTPSLQSMYSEKITKDLHRVSFPHEDKAYECSLHDLVKITHYIFDLFSTDYQYKLVRSVFTFTPEYHPIDVPYKLQTPKSLYPPPPKTTKTPMKNRDADKTKKETLPTAHKDHASKKEYSALMALKLREYIEITEREDKEKEEWKRKSHILPLNFAMEPGLIEKYWPPPKSPTGSLRSVKTGKRKE